MKTSIKQHLKNNYKTYIIAILIPLAVGGLSAFFTRGNMDIYERIKMPALSPPSFLFPIVWTILYILMGISSAIIWINREKDKSTAYKGLFTYFLSLIANFVWSLVFFNMMRFLLAFVILLILLYLILNTIHLYKEISKLAAYLQIPYFLWVLFAGYLNIGIWFLNQ